MQNDDFGGLVASERQKRMYFALMRKLGYDGETAKAKIRDKFKIDSFANVTSEELSEVINILKETKKWQTQNNKTLVQKN